MDETTFEMGYQALLEARNCSCHRSGGARVRRGPAGDVALWRSCSAAVTLRYICRGTLVRLETHRRAATAT